MCYCGDHPFEAYPRLFALPLFPLPPPRYPRLLALPLFSLFPLHPPRYPRLLLHINDEMGVMGEEAERVIEFLLHNGRLR